MDNEEEWWECNMVVGVLGGVGIGMFIEEGVIFFVVVVVDNNGWVWSWFGFGVDLLFYDMFYGYLFVGLWILKLFFLGY